MRVADLHPVNVAKSTLVKREDLRKRVWKNKRRYTRRVKEGIHIRLHPDNINKKNGIEIPRAWIPTIKKHNGRSVRQQTAEGTNWSLTSRETNTHRNNGDRYTPLPKLHDRTFRNLPPLFLLKLVAHETPNAQSVISIEFTCINNLMKIFQYIIVKIFKWYGFGQEMRRYTNKNILFLICKVYCCIPQPRFLGKRNKNVAKREDVYLYAFYLNHSPSQKGRTFYTLKNDDR